MQGTPTPSPCIDAGTNDSGTYPDIPSDDRDGDSRPQGTDYDIGSDEYVAAGPTCVDNDSDGYGVCPDCDIANGCTYDGDDCNDGDPDINPGAIEVTCNGDDDDCNAATLDVDDADIDTYDTCDPADPGDTDGKDADCNDGDDTIYPGATEVTCDCIDQDCSGADDCAVPVVVDNPDATFAGTWSTFVGHADGYGADLRYKAGGDGSATATWIPNVPTAGTYDVYAWWITGSSRATNAPYTINYDGDSETVRVNQKATTGQWNYLGTYPFAAGTAGSMVLSDGPDAGGVVLADAIKLEPKTGDLEDNPDATFAGTWSTFVGHPDGYGADLRYKAGGDGSATATWIPNVPTAGTYDVYAWWITGSSRATNAPYTINYDGDSETVRVNQKATTGQWNYLGTYPFAAGTAGSMVLSDGPDAGGVVCADAIKLEPKTGDLVDNPYATFAGTWSTFVGHPDGYGDDLQYTDEGDGSATATWIPDVPTAGTYDVYAWWITGGSRATNAPYTINYDGGSETVRVNQKATTGQWNYLGTYPFAACAAASVVLSDGPDADGVVCADAIKLENLE